MGFFSVRRGRRGAGTAATALAAVETSSLTAADRAAAGLIGV